MIRLEKDLEDKIDNFKHKKAFTHLYFSCAVIGEDKPRYEYFTYKDNKRYVFDLASLTKALVTAPLVVDSLGWDLTKLKCSLDQWLGKHANNLHLNLKKTRVLDLLRHTSGLPAWTNLWVSCFNSEEHREFLGPIGDNDLVKRLEYIAARQKLELGSFLYSDVGYLLLGWCLKNANSKILSEQHGMLYKKFFNRYSKHQPILWSCRDLLLNKAIPTAQYCPLRRGKVVGTVHDENSFVLGGQAGHAGAFSSGPGLTEYVGELIEVITTNLCMEKEFFFPGWLPGNISEHGFAGPRSLGHQGFTGTSFFYWPDKKAYAICLLNRTYYNRNSSYHHLLRKMIYSFLSQMF